MNRDTAIDRIKKALKARSGKSWSVTGGRGTSWGWIEINTLPKRKTWQNVQTKTPEPPSPNARYRGVDCVTPHYRVVEGAEDAILSPADDPWAREAAEKGRTLIYNWEHEVPGEKFGHMSPDERVELGKLLGLGKVVHYQGESIPAGIDYREEYVARAEGREATVFGKPYWD
jgi:hypothetical protein